MLKVFLIPKLSSERTRRVVLEEKIAGNVKTMEILKSTSLMDVSQIENLLGHRDALTESTKAKSKELEELESKSSSSKSTLEALQLEIENLKGVCSGSQISLPLQNKKTIMDSP